VVFVHGTNSSPARWADMLNDLENDPRVHDHFTFWAFSYMSSRPIALSAADLRRELSEAVRILDPETTNACIQDMIVIGHSQGGLLTKMTAIDSGDRFWRTLSSEPFERALMSNDTRKIVKEALFVKPLPFVRRVVFVATPHRGSFLAGPQFVRRLIARLVTLPLDVVKASTELAAATLNGRASSESAASLERVPTSIDNMSPGNRFIRTLSDIPLSPDVKAHSIIPVDTDGPVEEGNDGVVKYKSAHIEGVESELVVRSPHSVQSNPYAIEEVRRILLLHLSESGCDGHGDGLANQSPAEPL
jgi:pimeloyl-ACP methyl ester carboxylesterase